MIISASEPNAVVVRFRPKLMPVILTKEDEVEMRLSGSREIALAPWWLLPDYALPIVARGAKHDG